MDSVVTALTTGFTVTIAFNALQAVAALIGLAILIQVGLMFFRWALLQYRLHESHKPGHL